MFWFYSLGEYSWIFYIAAIGVMIWSFIVQGRLNSLVKKYSNVPVASGKDANTCVREMLQGNEIYGVTIDYIPGNMTDNFNPRMTRLICLTPHMERIRSLQLQWQLTSADMPARPIPAW